MNCEQCQEILMEAAAAGEPVGGEAAGHVERCAGCLAIFGRERELFAGIDQGLRARVNEEPPAGFLARMQAQIAHDSQKKDAQKQSRWNSMWALAGAALALVLVIIAHPRGRLRQPPLTAESGKAPSLRALESSAITPSVRGSADHSRTRQHVRLDSAQQNSAQSPAAREPASSEPEVLVPPDEARAFGLFVARLAGRDAMAAAVARPAVEKAVERTAELPGVPSVDLADLQPNSRWNDPIDESTDSE